MADRKLDPLDESTVTRQEENPPEHVRDSGQGARQYESGRNPHTQAQRSNRQGDGKPTQQRTEDR